MVRWFRNMEGSETGRVSRGVVEKTTLKYLIAILCLTEYNIGVMIYMYQVARVLTFEIQMFRSKTFFTSSSIQTDRIAKCTLARGRVFFKFFSTKVAGPLRVNLPVGFSTYRYQMHVILIYRCNYYTSH